MKTSSPSNPKPLSPLKVLIMGPPGSRKTTFGLQWPNVHVLNCDNNLDGPTNILRKTLLPDLSFTYDNIRVDDDGKIIEVYECYDRLLKKLSLFQSDNSYKERSAVMVDSLSHVNEFIIRKVLKLKAKESMEPNHWTDFKSYAYMLLVSRLEQTGKTIICICHEVANVEAVGVMQQTIKSYEPFFQGKVGDMIGAFFTDVWRSRLDLISGNVKQTLETTKTPKCDFLKNSLGLPAELDITKGFPVLEPYLKDRL